MPPRRERTKDPGDVTIEHDPISEGVLITIALTDSDARRKILRVIEPDHLFEDRHRDAIVAIKEAERRKLHVDVATLQKVGAVDAEYLQQLIAIHGDPGNVEFHIQQVLWDFARLNSIRGPINALVQAIHNPLEEPSRVRALAQQVGGSFDNVSNQKFLRDPEELVHEMMQEIHIMRDGLDSYSYGIQELDYYETSTEDQIPTRRMIPAAAPAQITCLTGNSGIGKSTVSAQVAIGLGRNRRRVVYGAWEQKGNVTLRIMSCMALGIARSRLVKRPDHGGLTDEELELVESKALAISRWVRFLENPFNRKIGEKHNKDRNDRNLDILQQCLADSGCDVFIGDLWMRCLRDAKPEEESLALIRQQAMAEELKIHCILVQQQRFKDIETRADKRPTREGIKGSGAWVEVADTILGVHRPGAYKNIEDNVLEIDVLKQRYAPWPMAIEFEYDRDTGLIQNGKTVQYDSYDDEGTAEDYFNAGGAEGKKRKKGR